MKMTALQESDYRAFVDAVHQSLKRAPPGGPHAVRLEVSGSLARGELSPPYSDLDLVLIAPTGAGPTVRDGLPQLARTIRRELLAIFVDPLHPEACFCSIYRGPFKVDWWVYEEDEGGDRTIIWRGDNPPPYDWASHSWDWLWWLWGKARRGKDDTVRYELPRLWHFLTMNGIDPRRFHASVPKNATSLELLPLIRRTMDLLPDQNEALGCEIRRAIEGDEERK